MNEPLLLFDDHDNDERPDENSDFKNRCNTTLLYLLLFILESYHIEGVVEEENSCTMKKKCFVLVQWGNPCHPYLESTIVLSDATIQFVHHREGLASLKLAIISVICSPEVLQYYKTPCGPAIFGLFSSKR